MTQSFRTYELRSQAKKRKKKSSNRIKDKQVPHTLLQKLPPKSLTSPLNDKDIYGFKILTDKTICNYEDVSVYNLLFNNNNNDDDDDNDIKNKNEDNTIPEYLKKVSTKTVNDTLSNQIMSLLKSTTTTTTSNDKKLIYSVGYLEFQSFLHYMDNIKLYKNLLLKEKQDCIKYKDINNTFLKLCIFPKKKDDDDDDSPFVNDVKINILEIPKYYSQNINWATDIKFFFTNSSLPFYSVDIYTEKDNNIEIDDDKFQSFLYPFYIEHLLKLTFGNFDKRLRNTIFYLVSIYILSEKIKPINHFTKKWLHDLGIKQILDQFLNIFFILKSKINDGSLKLELVDQNWAILCLKSLLIKYNVLTFDEKFNKNNNIISTPKNRNINVGPVRTMEIPDILIFSIFNDPTRLYELIALYRPIIKKDINKDKQKYSCFEDNNDSQNNVNYILWDNTKNKWINIGVINNNNLKNIFLVSPELYYIAQIIASSNSVSTTTTTTTEETQKKNDNDHNNDNDYVDKTNTNNNNNKKKTEKTNNSVTFCLNKMINKILIYWQDLNFKQISKYFWRINDCYFLLGGKDNTNDNLIDILPLPMYNNNDDNENCFKSHDIKHLVHHMMKCKFFQNQIFPIVRKIYNNNPHKNEKDRKRKKRNDDDDDDNNKCLRKIINSRDTFTNSRTVEEEIQMEIQKEVCNHANTTTTTFRDDDDDDDDIVNRIWGYK